MSKQKLEDMIWRKRPRIEKREPVKSPKREIDLPADETEDRFKKEPPVTFSKSSTTKRSYSRLMLWLIALISLGFCAFAISLLFSKASIVINPKVKDISFNENFKASKGVNSNYFPYDLVVISGEEKKVIRATAEKDVKDFAIGTVVIYNNYSASPQALSIGTRLEGSNGKIYKTESKVTVPGKSKSGSPGFVEVKISGAQAGEEYNSEPLDFKIVGFKGTAKYASFYGRSKGPIAGGFAGKAPSVLDADKLMAINDLKKTLQKTLLQKATDQIPNGFILFKNAIFLNSDDSNVSYSYGEDKSMILTVKGTLYGILLNEGKLTSRIVKSVSGVTGDVYISNIRDLKFTLLSKDALSLADAQNIDFVLAGSPKIVWKTNIDKFTNELLGVSKKDFNSILSGYEGIDSASLTLSPAWKMSIPPDVKDIQVSVNYPK